jgi:hypothetical protein
MLFLHPQSVELDGQPLADVRAIAIDRAAARLVECWDDAGPHCTFADAPEQRATLRIAQDLRRADPAGKTPPDAPPLPGDKASLTFLVARNPSGAARKRVFATIVVTAVKHELHTAPSSNTPAATRTITGVAISTAGDTDPIGIEPA